MDEVKKAVLKGFSHREEAKHAREANMYLNPEGKEGATQPQIANEVHEAKYLSSSKRPCRFSRQGKLKKLVYP